MLLTFFLLVLLLVFSSTTNAFSNPSPSISSVRIGSLGTDFNSKLLAEPPKGDSSRSGFRRERLDKLAELEDSRVETDKGFVAYAAGAFVVLILLGVVAALVLQV